MFSVWKTSLGIWMKGRGLRCACAHQNKTDRRGGGCGVDFTALEAEQLLDNPCLCLARLQPAAGAAFHLAVLLAALWWKDEAEHRDRRAKAALRSSDSWHPSNPQSRLGQKLHQPPRGAGGGISAHWHCCRMTPPLHGVCLCVFPCKITPASKRHCASVWERSRRATNLDSNFAQLCMGLLGYISFAVAFCLWLFPKSIYEKNSTHAKASLFFLVWCLPRAWCLCESLPAFTPSAPHGRSHPPPTPSRVNLGHTKQKHQQCLARVVTPTIPSENKVQGPIGWGRWDLQSHPIHLKGVRVWKSVLSLALPHLPQPGLRERIVPLLASMLGGCYHFDSYTAPCCF